MKHARLGSYVGAPSSVTLYEDGNYEEVEDAYPLTHEELVFIFESKSNLLISSEIRIKFGLYSFAYFEFSKNVVEVCHFQMSRMALPSLRRFTRPYHNDEPFSVVFLLEQHVGIVQCASCGVDFSRQPQPPEDLVLEHVERFWNQRTCTYSTQQMQKKYVPSLSVG